MASPGERIRVPLLSSEVKRKGSPLWQFFETAFSRPATSACVRAVNDALARRPLLHERSIVGDDLRLVGTAFNYSVAMLCGANLETSLAWRMLREAPKSILGAGRKHAEKMLEALSDVLLRFSTTTADGIAEHQGAEAALVLAHLERDYKSEGFVFGQVWGAIGTARSLPAAWRRMTDRPDVLRDLSVLTEATTVLLRKAGLLDRPTKAFVRLDVTGIVAAEADLVIERTLLELKTSAKPRPFELHDLRQILGYALLDLHDECKLEQLVMLFPRHNHVASWSLADLLREIVPAGASTASDLRTRLVDHLRATSRSET